MVSWDDVFHDGERSVEPQFEGWEFTFQGMIFFQHLFAYRSVLSVLTPCQAKRVLDIGCGSGYGAELLSRVSKVVAIDIDPIAIEWAKTHHSAPNLDFMCASIRSPIIQAQKFDVIVAFQVIEHVPSSELPRFMEDICNIMDNNAICFFSTPNRLRRLRLFSKPKNPYHYMEYSPWSLRRMLRKYFDQVVIRGITGNSKVMIAEWRRGSRVTPIEYFVLGFVEGLGRCLLKVVPGAAKRLIKQSLIRLATYLITLVRGNVWNGGVCSDNWRSDEPFSHNDFAVTDDIDWWCLDLFAEFRRY